MSFFFNFIVDNFFIWNHLCEKSYISISHIWIQNYQTTLDGETIETKDVDLEKLYNFLVDNLFIWIRAWTQILIAKYDEHKTRRMNIPNGHKCLVELWEKRARERLLDLWLVGFS